MTQNVNMIGSSEQERMEIGRRHGAIRTALWLLAFSQVLPILQYLWQVYGQ